MCSRAHMAKQQSLFLLPRVDSPSSQLSGLLLGLKMESSMSVRVTTTSACFVVPLIVIEACSSHVVISSHTVSLVPKSLRPLHPVY